MTALDLRHTATVLFGAIVLIGILGLLTSWLDPGNAWLDLDSEISLAWPPSRITLALPAVWSSITLAFGGTAWIAVGWVRPAGVARVAALGFGALMLVAAVDELFIVHERLEIRSGLDWQLIYVPVAGLAVALLGILAWQSRHRGHGIIAMLVLGSLTWAAAAALELTQWRGDQEVELYVLLMIPEELLELTGTALLSMAGITLLQSAASESKGAPPLVVEPN